VSMYQCFACGESIFAGNKHLCPPQPINVLYKKKEEILFKSVNFNQKNINLVGDRS